MGVYLLPSPCRLWLENCTMLLSGRGVLSEDAPFADIFLANVYEKGQFTLNHIDAKYIKRPLIVTSLLSSGTMVFGKKLARDQEKSGGRFFGKKAAPLRSRSGCRPVARWCSTVCRRTTSSTRSTASTSGACRSSCASPRR